jgi:hypothetical protein
MEHCQKIIAIDPGETISGVATYMDGNIIEGKILTNSEVIPYVKTQIINDDVIVLIEDMRPYNVRSTNTIIDTIKFIGELQYRLTVEVGAHYTLIPRWQIRKWVYDEYQDLIMPSLLKKVENAQKKLTKPRKLAVTFAYVDDYAVIRAMKHEWKIPNDNRYYKNKYGLSEHSWQALALITCYISATGPFALLRQAIL